MYSTWGTYLSQQSTYLWLGLRITCIYSLLYRLQVGIYYDIFISIQVWLSARLIDILLYIIILEYRSLSSNPTPISLVLVHLLSHSLTLTLSLPGYIGLNAGIGSHHTCHVKQVYSSYNIYTCRKVEQKVQVYIYIYTLTHIPIRNTRTCTREQSYTN